MAGRRLGAEERALWARVIETVTPLQPVRPPEPKPAEAAPPPAPTPPKARAKPAGRVPAMPALVPPTKPKPPSIGTTLDGSWDRTLGKGAVRPDSVVDLHGHTLDSAHRLVDSSLERAIADRDRVLLLITGKPPQVSRISVSPRRGLIRAAVGDWLAHSRHAGSIAAVRNAHPRHGGAGALYIILKRPRSSTVP